MASSTKRRNLYSVYFVLQMAIIIILGVSASFFIAVRSSLSIKRPLQQRAMSIASFFTPQEVNSLLGSEEDLNTTEYRVLKERLVRIKNANSDVRFIYLNGMKNGKVFFYGDSENPDSSDYSPPGEEYTEASQEFKDIFTTGEPFVEGPLRDRWGNWLSAIAPIKDASGKVVATVGMDTVAGNFQNTVYTYASMPIIGMGLLLLLSTVGYLYIRRRDDYVNQRDEFLSMASHELSVPLSSLKKSMEELQRNLQYKEPPEKITETVDLMVGSVQSLNKTTTSLLNLVGLESGKASDLNLTSVDLVETMRDIVNGLDLTAQQKNVEIIFAASWPAVLAVRCDPEKLHRALANVMANAVKYTDPSSTVTISYNRESDRHLISISDHGPGIPENLGDEIFKGHYRVENDINRSIPGDGLGLYISRRIIEQHGGTISYSSREGEGTIFFISLPI